MTELICARQVEIGWPSAGFFAAVSYYIRTRRVPGLRGLPPNGHKEELAPLPASADPVNGPP